LARKHTTFPYRGEAVEEVVEVLDFTKFFELNSGHPRGGLLRFACKAARPAPFQPFTGWLKTPAATGSEPSSVNSPATASA